MEQKDGEGAAVPEPQCGFPPEVWGHCFSLLEDVRDRVAVAAVLNPPPLAKHQSIAINSNQNKAEWGSCGQVCSEWAQLAWRECRTLNLARYAEAITGSPSCFLFGEVRAVWAGPPACCHSHGTNHPHHSSKGRAPSSLQESGRAQPA